MVQGWADSTRSFSPTKYINPLKQKKDAMRKNPRAHLIQTYPKSKNSLYYVYLALIPS